MATPRTAGRGLAPALAPALMLALAAVAGLRAADPPPTASVYGRSASPAAGEQPQAERIVAGALLALDRADPFVAKLRQKARIGSRVLTGPGRYVQAGTGEEQRFRFESRLECASDPATVSESFEVVEVCDGPFAWGYRRNASEPPALSRIDVRRVRDKLQELQVPEPQDASRYIGGLQRTLWTIREWFRFETAEPADCAGTPAWRVVGRWDPDRLAGLLPELAEAARRPGGIEPRELPDGVPWCVVLWVGRADLLPRRVEWLAIPGERPVTAADPEPIAVLDIHDIEIGGRVDATAFFYKPAGVGLMDVTEQRIGALRAWRP